MPANIQSCSLILAKGRIHAYGRGDVTIGKQKQQCLLHDLVSFSYTPAYLLVCSLKQDIFKRTGIWVYRSLAKKGPWALYLTLSPDKGVGGYL